MQTSSFVEKKSCRLKEDNIILCLFLIIEDHARTRTRVGGDKAERPKSRESVAVSHSVTPSANLIKVASRLAQTARLR